MHSFKFVHVNHFPYGAGVDVIYLVVFELLDYFGSARLFHINLVLNAAALDLNN
jgi:hypothetical protein